MRDIDAVVVGAGLFGLTIAERIANEGGRRVLIIDKRDHIGGNAWSFTHPSGIEVHAYGSHIFHTSNDAIWHYVNQFTQFNSYQHRVLTAHNGEVYSFPINLHTLNQFFRKDLDPAGARKLLDLERSRDQPTDEMDFRNLEAKAIRMIGPSLYNAFVAGYTEKQWQTAPRDLPEEIINRIPVRFNYDSRYFTDTYQGIPLNGYAAWFQRIVDNPLIEIELGVDFLKSNHRFNRENVSGQLLVVYSGALDAYYDYRFGALGWRTLEFEHDVLNVADHQGVAVMNYADKEVPFTRVHEYKHFHPERHSDAPSTFVSREYSRSAGIGDDPYYPINGRSDREMLSLYRDLARSERMTLFGGRLGSYKYLDMHTAVGSAMSLWRNKIAQRLP